ncbi:MAG: AMP-binding protein, partial [bacterium]|nr:AMP-binding protein [bacterium]
LPVVDLRRSSPDAARAEAERLIRGAARRPFDLAHPPLLRTLLVRLERDQHLLLLSMHHIVSDGWSDGILIRELGRFYQAFRAGQPSPLPALPVQYADFAHWQRRWLRGPELDKLLAYWKEQLAGPPSVLELPTDRPRPAVQHLRGARFPVRLQADLTSGLKKIGRDRETTLFMTLLGALQLLLGRYTGQRDFCVGSPVANRRRSEIEGLIGFFVNTLVLRADLRRDHRNPGFLALLDQVRRVTLGAYAHQELPFGVLVEELSPERDLSHSPLVQVLFALQNAPGEALELPGLTLHLQEIDDGTAKFDLSLYLTERDEGLSGFLEYDVDLFDRTTAARLIEHFRILLAEIVQAPERGIAELALLGRAESRQLLAEWNDTDQELPRASTWLRLFEAQVEGRPEAVALGCGPGVELSYRELDRRSNRLAHHLRRLGVAPGVLVAICVERSPAMVVGLLGILKAGGAYVPLDPAHPRERLAAVLEDTRAPLLLSQQDLVPALPAYSGELVLLDAGPEHPAREPDDRPPCRVTGDDLAYVIYTSGSTGRPKGVQIPHRALLNFLTAMHRRPGLGAGDVLVAVTTLSFDIAALELYLPLMVGARVEIASRETAADGARLRELLAAVGATAMQATPVTWRLLLAAGWPGRERFAILCGGEALPAELAEELAEWRGQLW